MCTSCMLMEGSGGTVGGAAGGVAAGAAIDTMACRLPRNVRPVQYDLAVVPNLEDWTYDGHVRTRVQVLEATTSITLNVADITIATTEAGVPKVSIQLDGGAGEIVACVSQAEDAREQRLTFVFASAIPVGDAVLSIHFHAVLNDNMCGFYRSTYKKPAALCALGESSESRIAVTQLEATDARRAFPCWDEPALKATFLVTLIVPPRYRAISNMPVVTQLTVQASSTYSSAADFEIHRGLTFPAGHVRYVFDQTPIMSTYLLALIVGEFEYLSAFTKNRVEVRVYAPVGKGHLGRFALDVASRCLPFYEELFGIPFPLPKMDLIAIPDFAAGAMENWGAVTYRETAVLVNPETTPLAVKQQCTRTVCHEIAHMWFGNLVTMEWWTYLWLNEGFARFIEFSAVDHLFPEWKIWDSFVLSVYSAALSLDSMSTTHPVEVPVAHPDQINEIFDTISYAKGASVIRMLSNALGRDKFIAGLRTYLKRHAYGNTVSTDLWNALSEESGLNVANIMRVWLGESAYPVVRVTDVTEANSTSGRTLDVEQAQFVGTPARALAAANGREATSSSSSDASTRRWAVPMNATAFVDGAPVETVQVILDYVQRGQLVFTSAAARHATIKVNVGQIDFYRVHYSPDLFAPLQRDISRMSTVDRIGIVRDAFALSKIGAIDVTAFLNLAKSFEKEQTFEVAVALDMCLSELSAAHSDQPYSAALERFIASVFRWNFERLGWVPSAPSSSRAPVDINENRFRALAIRNVGGAMDEPVLARCRALVHAFADEPASHPILSDLRSTAYALAAKCGGTQVQGQLMRIYARSTAAEDRVQVLATIGDVTGDGEHDTACVQRLIEWMFSSSDVRSGDMATLIASICASKVGRELMWAAFQAHWDDFFPKFSKGQNFVLASMLSSLLHRFTSEADAVRVEAWFREHPVPSADRTIRQSLERIYTRAQMVHEQSAALTEFFATA